MLSPTETAPSCIGIVETFNSAAEEDAPGFSRRWTCATCLSVREPSGRATPRSTLPHHTSTSTGVCLMSGMVSRLRLPRCHQCCRQTVSSSHALKTTEVVFSEGRKRPANLTCERTPKMTSRAIHLAVCMFSLSNFALVAWTLVFVACICATICCICSSVVIVCSALSLDVTTAPIKATSTWFRRL